MGGDATTPRRRRVASSPAPAPPLEDDNILEQILLRLPTRPSSLPRAAAVCKRWRHLVSDPQFRRRFRAHHREPPLIGVFLRPMIGGPYFHSILDPPDAIPAERFSLWDRDDVAARGSWSLFGCRHGRVLVFNHTRLQVIVWEPVSGDRHCVPAPPEVHDKEMEVCHGDVLCVADDLDHVHGVECHTSPFKVVLICYSIDESEWYGCVYSSSTGKWGDLSSAEIPGMGCIVTPGVLSGDSLYWFSENISAGILKFDLVSQSLAVVELPPDLDTKYMYIGNFCVLRTNNGGVGLAVLTDFRLDMWERKVSCNGAATWLLQKTVKLKMITGLSRMQRNDAQIHGYDEDGAVIFILTYSNFFTVQLDSMKFRNLGQSKFITSFVCHPYRNFLC